MEKSSKSASFVKSLDLVPGRFIENPPLVLTPLGLGLLVAPVFAALVMLAVAAVGSPVLVCPRLQVAFGVLCGGLYPQITQLPYGTSSGVMLDGH